LTKIQNRKVSFYEVDKDLSATLRKILAGMIFAFITSPFVLRKELSLLSELLDARLTRFVGLMA